MMIMHDSRNFLRSASSWLACLLGVLAVGACNGDDEDDPDDGAAISMAGGASLLPAPIPGARGATNPPTLGDRVDRAGRVAITAALVDAFNPDADAQAATRKAYNASGLGNQAFAATIRASLGVLDSLDGVCGTQVLAAQQGNDRYGAFTAVLLDDQLYLNSDRPGSVYLGLEAEAVGALMPGQGAGGGREPNDDVIARSYSVLAKGALDGVDDGVAVDDVRHDPDRFPFLAPPQ
jgi:hypothetical protein